MLRVATGWLLLLLPGNALATPDNLYEWLATAPVVVAGTVTDDESRYVEVVVSRTLRGDIAPGHPVYIDLKRANRDRDLGERALRLSAGFQYLLLLEPSAKRKKLSPLFDLVRGHEGAKRPPPESAESWLDVAERFARIQDLKDDLATWNEMRGFLDETNPILIETALRMFLKFRRGEASMLPSVRPFLDHPRPDLRALAARLAGQILGRLSRTDPTADESALVADLISHARRDDAVEVRAASTRALGAIPTPSIDVVLQEIAREDPERSVRYEAERVLYERGREAGAADGTEEGPDGR